MSTPESQGSDPTIPPPEEAAPLPSQADVAEIKDKRSRWRQDRMHHEPIWFLTAAFNRGSHYTEWDELTSQLVKIRSAPNRVRLTINRMQAKTRGRISKFVKNRPRVIVTPGTSEYTDYLNAKATQKYCDYQYRKLGFESKYKRAVLWCVDASRGFIWLHWDPSKLARLMVKNPIRAERVRRPAARGHRPGGRVPLRGPRSIGQEGLDFHTWCHAVVHWNLPSNPVNLEQREGRVHRYKGHAVRKNVAERYGLTALSEAHEEGDPWQTLFKIAARGKSNGHSDLIPYWIFKDGSARVERRIPVLPFSKEVGKLKRLKQGLALYRMVFGQPRQEDLLFSLSQNGNLESADLTDWLISLQPPETAP